MEGNPPKGEPTVEQYRAAAIRQLARVHAEGNGDMIAFDLEPAFDAVVQPRIVASAEDGVRYYAQVQVWLRIDGDLALESVA